MSVSTNEITAHGFDGDYTGDQVQASIRRLEALANNTGVVREYVDDRRQHDAPGVGDIVIKAANAPDRGVNYGFGAPKGVGARGLVGRTVTYSMFDRTQPETGFKAVAPGKYPDGIDGFPPN